MAEHFTYSRSGNDNPLGVHFIVKHFRLLNTIYDIETSRDNIVIVVTNESKSF